MSTNSLTNLRLCVSSQVDGDVPTQTTAVEFEGTYWTCLWKLQDLFNLPRYETPGQTDEQKWLHYELTAFLNGRSIAPLVHPVYGRFSCVETCKR